MIWITCSHNEHDGDDNHPVNLSRADFYERETYEYKKDLNHYTIKFYFHHNYVRWYYPSEHERNKDYFHIQDRIRDMQK
jgi:hypothetical protein